MLGPLAASETGRFYKPGSEHEWPRGSGRVPLARSDKCVHVPSHLVEDFHEPDGVGLEQYSKYQIVVLSLVTHRRAGAIVELAQVSNMARMIRRIKILLEIEIQVLHRSTGGLAYHSIPTRRKMKTVVQSRFAVRGWEPVAIWDGAVRNENKRNTPLRLTISRDIVAVSEAGEEGSTLR